MYSRQINCKFAKLKNKMKTALITGASNGIGLALAKVHASKGDNLVLVARNKSKLDEIKLEFEKNYKILVYVIGIDLSIKNTAQLVYDKLFNKQCRLW